MSNIFKNLWVSKYQPLTLDDIILSKENRQYFERIEEAQEIPHLIFHGKPGIGKSALAKILVKNVLNCQYLYINASDETGIDTIRSKVINFAQTASFDGKIKVVLLDEVDGLSSVQRGDSGKTSAQQALRNVIEEYAETTRFILTCNYPFKVMEALHSRCQEFDLTPPFEECVKRVISILKKEKIQVPDNMKEKVVDLTKKKYPDLRSIINSFHKYSISGTLQIPDKLDDLVFVESIFNKLIDKENILDLRTYIIQNEVEFANDYHQLLRNLFEVSYESDLDFNAKRMVMLHISNAMYQHQIIMDPEINCFACLLNITEVLEK